MEMHCVPICHVPISRRKNKKLTAATAQPTTIHTVAIKLHVHRRRGCRRPALPPRFALCKQQGGGGGGVYVRRRVRITQSAIFYAFDMRKCVEINRQCVAIYKSYLCFLWSPPFF